jgi:hypothetical protein
MVERPSGSEFAEAGEKGQGRLPCDHPGCSADNPFRCRSQAAQGDGLQIRYSPVRIRAAPLPAGSSVSRTCSRFFLRALSSIGVKDFAAEFARTGYPLPSSDPNMMCCDFDDSQFVQRCFAPKGNAVKYFCGQQTRSVEVAELARVQTNNHRRRNSCEFRYKNASQRCPKGTGCCRRLETSPSPGPIGVAQNRTCRPSTKTRHIVPTWAKWIPSSQEFRHPRSFV